MADLESKVAEEEFSRGGDLELYISAALALLLGLMYTAFGLANLFGQLLGPKGKIFIFEMDEVDNGTIVWETFLFFSGDGWAAGNPELFKTGSDSSFPWSGRRVSLLVFSGVVLTRVYLIQSHLTAQCAHSELN